MPYRQAYSVLYADKELLLCIKPAGVPSQPDPTGAPDLLSGLTVAYPTAQLVHRLDNPTGGVMVFGLTPRATARLSALVQEHEVFCKEYLAVIPAPLPEPEGRLEDRLYHDKRQNKAFVVNTDRKGAKDASLTYRTLATAEDGHTLLLIRLYTGRTHQIRVQFASRGFPLVGDGRYGSREKCPFIGLWSYRLTFPHPSTGRRTEAHALPPSDKIPWAYFENFLTQNIF